MVKKGQVTAFIIIGIIILLVVGAVYFVQNYVLKSAIQRQIERESLLPEQIQPVRSTIENCLKQTTQTAVQTMGLQGGYITMPQDQLPVTPVDPFSNKLEVVPGLSTPYWFYETSNGIQTSQQPTLDDMQNQLSDYINSNFKLCISNLTTLKDEGYDFLATQEPNATSLIKDNSVDVEVNYPININYKNATFRLDSYAISLASNLGQLYKLASNVQDKENKESFLEVRTVDMLAVYPDVPLDGVDFSCSPKIWSKTDITQKLREILSPNINAIVLKGTPFTPLNEAYKYFVVDAGDVGDTNANFMYSTAWPLSLDAEPSSGDIMQENTVTQNLNTQEIQASASLTCINTYHFVYTIKYPVLITLTDKNGLVFQYATEVIIKNNQPKINTIPPLNIDTTPILCENPVTDMDIYTLSPAPDGSLQPIGNVSVSFKCFTTSCPIGSTDLDQAGQYALHAKFPACLNGAIVAQKDGYLPTKQIVSTNLPGSLSLILEPYYPKNITVKLIEKDTGTIRDPYDNEQVIVQFINNDTNYQAYYAYPSENNQVKLVVGDYQIKSYVIQNSTWPVQIKSQKITKCAQVPGASIFGLFLTQQQCTDVTLPQITLNQALKGGVSFGYSLTRPQLTSNNPLTIYIPVDKTPSTYDDLNKVYETIDTNSQNQYFKYPE